MCICHAYKRCLPFTKQCLELRRLTNTVQNPLPRRTFETPRVVSAAQSTSLFNGTLSREALRASSDMRRRGYFFCLR